MESVLTVLPHNEINRDSVWLCNHDATTAILTMQILRVCNKKSLY